MGVEQLTNGNLAAGSQSEPGLAPDADNPVRPRTLTVLGLLVTAALVLSYLVAYALTDALRAADVLPHWTPGHDPRPRWLLIGFGTVMTVFLATGVAFRMLSQRQLRRIDAMADDL